MCPCILRREFFSFHETVSQWIPFFIKRKAFIINLSLSCLFYWCCKHLIYCRVCLWFCSQHNDTSSNVDWDRLNRDGNSISIAAWKGHKLELAAIVKSCPVGVGVRVEFSVICGSRTSVLTIVTEHGCTAFIADGSEQVWQAGIRLEKMSDCVGNWCWLILYLASQ